MGVTPTILESALSMIKPASLLHLGGPVEEKGKERKGGRMKKQVRMERKEEEKEKEKKKRLFHSPHPNRFEDLS